MTTQNENKGLVIQGRIVWGVSKNLFEGRPKQDFDTKQIKIGADGNPVMEYGFGLAIPKIDARTGQNSEDYVRVWQALHAEALSLYPNGVVPPNFAMKFKDGDGIDDKGLPFSKREGYAGHIVLACTTQIPPKYFIFQGGNNILVSTGIKIGDYVNVQLSIKAHPAKGQFKAGLYVSPLAIQLITEGPEIINSPSGDQLFGVAAPVYNGQAIAPTAPAMPIQPQAPTQPQAPVAPVAQPQAPVAQPNYQVLPPTMQPQMGNVPPVGTVGAVYATPIQTTSTQQPPMATPQGNGYALPAAPSNGLPQAIQAPVMPVVSGVIQ